jgi:hypothetical protein
MAEIANDHLRATSGSLRIPIYSITSSARAISIGGTVSPSASRGLSIDRTAPGSEIRRAS